MTRPWKIKLGVGWWRCGLWQFWGTSRVSFWWRPDRWNITWTVRFARNYCNHFLWTLTWYRLHRICRCLGLRGSWSWVNRSRFRLMKWCTNKCFMADFLGFFDNLGADDFWLVVLYSLDFGSWFSIYFRFLINSRILNCISLLILNESFMVQQHSSLKIDGVAVI